MMMSRKNQIPPPINNQEETCMNAFDLYIESVKFEYRGYFEIKWRRGRKLTQTLKYQSEGKTTSIRETLTLNITLTTKNNRIVQKSTILDIVDAHSDIIESISLPVHRWTSQFTSLELAISKGIIKAKARRRQLMSLKVSPTLSSPQSLVIANSDDDQYSELFEQQINARMMMSQTKNPRLPIDNQRDETTKLRKQLEDSLYVNNKLKNDRSILLSRNIQLESQICFLKTQIKEELRKLQKYYTDKMEAHEAIYEDEINSIITIYNGNSDYNAVIMKQIQGDLRKQRECHASAIKEMESYQQKMRDIEREKQELKDSIKQFIHQADLERAANNECKLQLQSQVSRLRNAATEVNESLLSSRRTIEALQRDKINLQNEKLSVETELQFSKNEIRLLQKRVEELLNQFEQSRNQLQFTEQAYKRQKQSGQNNQQAYRVHISKLQQIITQFESREVMSRQERVGKEESYIKENQSLRKEIMRLRGEVERANEQLVGAKKRSEEQEQQYLKQIEALAKEVEIQKKLSQAKFKQLELDQSKSHLQIEQALNEKSEQMQKLKAQLNFLKSQNQNAAKQNKDLKQLNQKLSEQLQFINENAIKIEEHDQLHSRVVELQTKLAEYELHYQNVDFPSFQKQMGEPDKKQKAKQQNKNVNKPDAQNISFEGEPLEQKMKLLEQKLKGSNLQIDELRQENNELRDRLESTIKQFQQLCLREKNLVNQLQMAKATQMKIIEYCESQQEPCKNLTDLKGKVNSQPVVQEKQLMSFAQDSFENKKKTKVQQHNHNSAQNVLEAQMKIKRSTSLREMGNKKKLKKDSLLQSEVVLEEPHDLSIQVDSNKRPERVKQYQETQFSKSQSRARRDQIIRLSQTQNRETKGSKSNKKSLIASKISEFKGQIGESNRDVLSSKSVGSNQQEESRSRESYVSGTTLYKFKRVTHRQKIKLLEDEMMEYQKFVEQLKQRENEVLGEMQRANERVLQFEKQLKLLQEDRHALKATLHFELEKKSTQRENRGAQTEQKQKQSKLVEANIILEDPEKTNLSIELTKKQKENNEQQAKFQLVIKEEAIKFKNMHVKLEESEKKLEQVSKKFQEKSEETEKLKKELRLVEQKQLESRNLLQTSRLERSQAQFFIQKHEAENKKLKLLVEDLQEKVKKNDILDQYRQLEYEFENANKRLLDLNRQIYQSKLEKDTIQDEVKLVKKKNVDLAKKCSELEYTIESQQKNIEEYKRKESRQRRELENKEDANQKLKDQGKRLNDEISMLKGLNNQQIFERKKYMDQIAGLQHSSQRKQYELLSLKKQMERLRYKIQQKEEEKSENKQSLRRQIQALESELSQKNKQILELQSSIKQLSIQHQALVAENKRHMNEKSGVYSEKLKVYIEQITEIKKLLDENNAETINLKHQLKDYEQEVLNLRGHSKKLEEKLNDEINGNKQLISLLQEEHNKTQNLKTRLQELMEEQYGLKSLVKNTRADLDQERKQHTLRKQQAQQLGKANEALLDQINKGKVRISEYETQLQINRNYNERLTQNDKELRATAKELKEIKKSYDEYRTKFVHTADDMETSLKNLQTKWRDKYQLLQSHLLEECEVNTNKCKKQLQSEILQLLSELSNARVQSQKKSQLISQMEFKIIKLEILPLKLQQLEKLYNQKLQENKKLKSIDAMCKELREKAEKAEATADRTIKNNEELAQLLQQMEGKSKSMELAMERMSGNNKCLQKENNSLLRDITQLRQQEAALKQEMQNLISSIKTQEEEKASLLQKSEEHRKQHNEKISRLEGKLEEMSSTVQEHEQALSSHYEKNLDEIKLELEKMYEELQGKEKIILENEDLISKLQYEVQSQKKQMARLREKEASESEILEMEYNKLKNKMAEKQKQHSIQIHELQTEVQEMSKQLTTIKLQTLTNIQAPKQQNLGTAINTMRLEQKLKQKDLKLEDLKQSIYLLEETVVKLKKKQVILAESSEKLAKLQKDNSEYSTQLRRLQEQLRRASAKEFNLSQAFKLEANSLKAANEKLKIEIQQKQMEAQSAGYQLKTLKELYGELKKQLQKRNISNKQKAEKQFKLTDQVQKDSQKIVQLEDSLRQKSQMEKKMLDQIGKKNQAIRQLEQKLMSYERVEVKLKSASKVNNEGQHYKNEIRRLGEENQTLQKLNKQLREEMQKLEKDNYETRTKLYLNQSSIDSLNATLEDMSSKLKELEQNHKHLQDLNEACYKIFHFGLDEAIFHGYLSRRIDEKDLQINNLVEEVEQLKFLNERKQLDYDELRKQNYELQLRLQDTEFAEDQVDELRQICDKLEQEKKDAIYRQELLKLQIETIFESGYSETKEKLDRMKFEEIIRRLPNGNNHSRISFS